jgi:hypothetical protein
MDGKAFTFFFPYFPLFPYFPFSLLQAERLRKQKGKGRAEKALFAHALPFCFAAYRKECNAGGV